MARKSMDVPASFIEAVLALPRALDISVLAVDGGRSTGVTFLDAGPRFCFSMQCAPKDIGDMLTLAVGERRACVFVREAPYTGTRASAEEGSSRSTPAALYKNGLAAGYATRAVEPWLRDDHAFWNPMPSTWRSLLKLNRKKTPVASARDETNAAVHLWAEAHAKKSMRGPGGALLLDEANSYGMAVAGAYLVANIIRRFRS